ncbi:hypothetical protein MKX03_005881 [Papaver bracteatum]|nr:hypothetical protein MKX03_005881 [Papaver bracteatum]
MLPKGIPDQRTEPVPSDGPNANQLLRSMVQRDPNILRLMLEELKNQKPNLAELIERNQDDLLSLILNPVEGDEDITEKEGEAIDRLETMGFPRAVVLKVFLACDKNVELAAEYLASAPR